MIRNILKNNRFSFPKKSMSIMKYLYFSLLSRYLWSSRYKVNIKNGFKFKKLTESQITEYKNYWKGFNKKIDTKTVAMCYSISNVFDKRIIPEDIFFSDIELTLNQSNNIPFFENKSIYNKWFNDGVFPLDFLHRINGKYFNSSLELISELDALAIISNLSYPLVIKPNVDSFGGANVSFPESESELLKIISELPSFVLQEKIMQHNSLNNIYESVNTVRVCLYKSVKDDQWHIINASLRMGKDGSLDNETDGGIVCSINENGYLNGYALDKYGNKFHQHPNSEVLFDIQIPFYKDMCNTAIAVSEQILYARIVSLDLCLDKEGKWRAIEVNLQGHTIRFAQYTGKPFFGKFTDEVVEYCVNNHWGFKDQKLFS